MKKISLLLGFLLFIGTIYAQNRTFKGSIISGGSATGLSGAHITIYNFSEEVVYQGISGKDGVFSIPSLPAEKLIVTVSYVGYRFSKQTIDLTGEDLLLHKIILESSPVEVGEVIVSAQRQDKMLRDISLPIAVVTKNRVDQLPAITPANLFEDVPGVNLARDGIWATSLNIRGLTEQRIIMLVDGNRIETATDLAAGLAMIDVNDIERIEVIKGAASSLYGTGALGGVVNIITKDGHYQDDFYAGGSITGIYQTVNHLHSENVSVDLADKNWFFRLAGTYRDAENAMTPEGELLNSQFTDNNISLKLGVKPVKNQEITLNYQRFGAKDVGIPGGVAFPATATAIYPKELRSMISLTNTITYSSGALQQIKIRYFHQDILRDVELKPNQAVTITPTGFHSTNGLQLQSDWNAGGNHQFILGLDLWQRFLSTERERTIVSPIMDSTGTVIGKNTNVRGEVPIPDAWFTSGGVFAQDQISLLDERLTLTLGGRFDLINTRNEKAVDPLYVIANGIRNENPPNQRITFEANNINNYSWSMDAGALYRLFPKTDLTLTLSKSYRAPGIEERFKYIDLGSLVKIGDPSLKPEQGYFADFGTRVWMDKFQFTGNIFVNKMTNLIVEKAGIFVYNYSAQSENFDTINALINTNIDKALLYGFDLSAGYNIFDGVTVKAMAGFVRGKNLLNETDLPQIPPMNGRLSIKYNLRGYFSTELSVNLTADQDKIATGETVSKGYAVYDMGIYTTPVKLWKTRMEAFGGVQNITDRAFKNHLSTNRGLVKYEPGRNFYLKIRLSF